MTTISSQDQLNGLIFDYDSGIIPPPYSHVFNLTLKWTNEKLDVKLNLHYTDRDDLSEQEILDEGFTTKDDFSYNGPLSFVWVKPAIDLYKKSKWSGKAIDEGGITVTPVQSGKTGGVKIPFHQEEWLLLAQDLIQAIYETVKKELPLKINYRKVEQDLRIDCSLTIYFSNREVLFEANGKKKIIHWEYAIQLMKVVFTPDYHYEFAKEEPGTKRGFYIDCGDGYWHELGKGAINIDPSFDAVGKIKAGFDDLIGE